MTQKQQYTTEERYTHIREATHDLIIKSQGYIQEEQQNHPDDLWTNDVANKLTRCRKKWNEQVFKIAVLALVKAGKSTLINAWLGNEFMPASAVPETARIVRIKHTPGSQQGTLIDGNRTIHGVTEICSYLHRLNADVREQGTMPSIDELILEAPLVALENSPLGEQHFEILDTPGPNEAGTNLKEKIEKTLDDVDVIIYVLDYTKLKTVEEAEMFAKLAEVRLDLLNSQRLLFVVNKVDMMNRHNHKLDDIKEYIVQLLKNQINDLKITSDRILFISAEEALLARMVQSGQASDKALKDFAQRVFGLRDEDEEEPTLKECQDRAPKLFKKGGMLALETTILNSIYSRSGIILLESLLGDLDRYLQAFSNGLVTRQSVLQADQQQFRGQAKDLESKLDSINKQLEDVTHSTENFQKEVERFLRNKFASFQQMVDQMISEALGSESSSPVQQNRYIRVDQRIRQALGIDRFLSKITGLRNISSSNKRQVEEAAQKLNEEVADYLIKEFQNFLYSLSGELQNKQQPFFKELTQKVHNLSREVERVVGKALQVSFFPVAVDFDLPSPISLDEAIGIGIETTSETRTSSREERYVRDKILWLIPIYATRTVYDTTTYTTHTVDIAAIQNFWREQIIEKMQETTQAVNEKSNQEIYAAVHKAEKDLRDFSDNYIDNIKKSMDVASQGEQQRQHLSEQTELRLQQLIVLRKNIAGSQEALNHLKA